MGKIKRFFSVKSIKKDFVISTFLFILSALILSFFCSGLLQKSQDRIVNKYWDHFNQYHHLIHLQNDYDESGALLNDDKDPSFYINYSMQDYTTLFNPFDDFLYNLLGFLIFAVYPISFIICLFLTSILFYKKTLQKPLEILAHAADQISDNNLDFEIIYQKQNELGKLCSSFEKMRRALWNNNTEMWRQIEERKRLNAAFAHDLRTPLTVLKGQSEMLMKYAPKMSEEQIIETADMMNRHILRLETYIMIMTNLQRLENIEVQKQPVVPESVIKQMNATGISLCRDKNFLFHEKPAGNLIPELDVSVVMRVYENLLANAVRYAAETITVSASLSEHVFQITVSDDGRGFSAKELSEAVGPFYKSPKETDPEHFGMGLNICKVLCEKHGGFLKLENKNGACVTAAFRF
ncbi:MAG: HAMP domain-containing histidine kinase [Lachnospiraceae bacterium]|nr:HAMP domain-containing histidine kinase [Lachnospiraceae bacterium]